MILIYWIIVFKSEVNGPSGTVLLRTSRNWSDRESLLNPYASILHKTMPPNPSPFERDGPPFKGGHLNYIFNKTKKQVLEVMCQVRGSIL